MNEEQERRIKNALVYGTSHPEMYKTELDVCKETIERQAAQIEMLRAAIHALELDSEECLDFDECTAMLVPIDTFHALIDAMVLNHDQALEQFAAKMRNKALDDAESALNKVMVTDHSLNTFKRCQQAIRSLKELP